MGGIKKEVGGIAEIERNERKTKVSGGGGVWEKRRERENSEEKYNTRGESRKRNEGEGSHFKDRNI